MLKTFHLCVQADCSCTAISFHHAVRFIQISIFQYLYILTDDLFKGLKPSEKKNTNIITHTEQYRIVRLNENKQPTMPTTKTPTTETNQEKKYDNTTSSIKVTLI